MQINIDRILQELPAIHDVTHRIETSFESLSGVAEHVSVLPDIDGKLTTLYEELIPAIPALRALQVITNVSTFSSPN